MMGLVYFPIMECQILDKADSKISKIGLNNLSSSIFILFWKWLLF